MKDPILQLCDQIRDTATKRRKKRKRIMANESSNFAIKLRTKQICPYCGVCGFLWLERNQLHLFCGVCAFLRLEKTQAAQRIDRT